MNILKIIPIFLLLVPTNIAFSQEKTISNSKYSQSEIQQEASKSLERWNYYLRNNLDSLKLDAKHILFIGIEGSNEFAIHVGKRSFGSYLIRTGQQSKGIEYLKAANKYFQKKENYVLQTEILNEIGNGFLNDGKPVEAEKYYLKSLRCGKKSSDPTSAFLAESNLAQAYISLGNTEKAKAILQHYKKEALKLNKIESVSSAYALLGTIEQLTGNMELAKEYFRKSANFGFKSNSISQIAHAYNNMAIVLFMEGSNSESLKFFNKALALRLKTKNAKSIAESYQNLGDYYAELKVYAEANNYYKKCETFCIEKKLRREQMDVVFSIAAIEKEQGNYESATQILDRYIDLQESYFSELSKNKTEDMEMLTFIENMEQENLSKTQEFKLISLIDDQNYHNKVLYIIFGFSIIAILILAIYKRKIN